MRGRKPKPIELAISEGTWRKDRHALPTQQVIPPEARPQCPDDLDEIAKAKWHEITKFQEEMGVLTIADKDLYESYAKTWSAYVRAERIIRKEGERVGDKRHPLSAVVHSYLALLLKWQSEMGHTPTARSRVAKASKDQPQRVMARQR